MYNQAINQGETRIYVFCWKYWKLKNGLNLSPTTLPPIDRVSNANACFKRPRNQAIYSRKHIRINIKVFNTHSMHRQSYFKIKCVNTFFRETKKSTVWERCTWFWNFFMLRLRCRGGRRKQASLPSLNTSIITKKTAMTD